MPDILKVFLILCGLMILNGVIQSARLIMQGIARRDAKKKKMELSAQRKAEAGPAKKPQALPARKQAAPAVAAVPKRPAPARLGPLPVPKDKPIPAAAFLMDARSSVKIYTIAEISAMFGD
jgi:hypothetical protein